ncbi:MAG: hypothetical protein Q9166_002037 [cf. Caloplaca sp. 2 TL-2023]
MQLAEHVWKQYASDINHGFVNMVVLDPVVENAIGGDGIALIVERLQSMVQAPVEVKKQDGLSTLIRTISHPNNGHDKVTATEPKANAKSKKDKVARPPNAFILYRQHHHPLVKSQNPDLHNNQISIMLGQQWQNETADVKAQFKSMAEDIKKKHLNAHPTYQYQPRKPNEKKRRMTRRKAEKLSAQGISSYVPTNDTAAISTFETTSTGNAVFTFGDDTINDDDDLLAMVKKHNDDLMAFTTNFNPNGAPVLFHERSEEAQNDALFYGNTLNFTNMYSSEHDTNELLPADADMLAAIAAIDDPTWEAAFDIANDKRQWAEVNRGLAQFSNLWAPSGSNEETPSLGDAM